MTPRDLDQLTALEFDSGCAWIDQYLQTER
jgi:hypothetical protein